MALLFMVIARFVGFFSVNNNDGSRKKGGRGFLLPLSFEEISDRLFAVAGLFHFRFQADSLGEAPEIGLPLPPPPSSLLLRGFWVSTPPLYLMEFLFVLNAFVVSGFVIMRKCSKNSPKSKK